MSQSGSRSRPQHMGGDGAGERLCLPEARIREASSVEIRPKRRYSRFRQAQTFAGSITAHVPWSGSAS